MKKISNLGINIKRIREAKGISGYKLAKIAGVGNSTISQIESGERQNLNSDTLIKISNALEVPTEDLIFEEGTTQMVATDMEESFLVLLSSDELTIDGKTANADEKKIVERYLSKAFSIIRTQRKDLE